MLYILFIDHIFVSKILQSASTFYLFFVAFRRCSLVFQVSGCINVFIVCSTFTDHLPLSASVFCIITADHKEYGSLLSANIKCSIIHCGIRYGCILFYADWWHSLCLSPSHCSRQVHVLAVIVHTMSTLSQYGFSKEKPPSPPP